MSTNIQNRNKDSGGFAVIAISFYLVIIMLMVILSISFLVLQRKKIAENFVKSTQSYYASEGGLEDALLRLTSSPKMSALSYSLNVKGISVGVVIEEIKNGSRNVIASADNKNIIKKTQAVFALGGTGVSFNYGAQVGEGGLQMSQNSKVQGNVFSNGSIKGKGTIENDVIISGKNGSQNTLEEVYVKGGALAPNCKNAEIEGDLTYLSGGKEESCKVKGSKKTQSEDIASAALPISTEQIASWKDEVEQGGTVSGNVIVQGNEKISLGPVKITGDLTVKNNAEVTIKGTIWVVGQIKTGNNAVLKLDSSYGSAGGIIISDGIVEISGNTEFLGSGQEDSYILVIATSSSDSAMTLENNAEGAIFYASSGGVLIKNNIVVKSVTGYKLKLDNNAVIKYETGLADSFFSGGPSEEFGIVSWEEK